MPSVPDIPRSGGVDGGLFIANLDASGVGKEVRETFGEGCLQAKGQTRRF
jgi:hypothetical protein